MFLSNVYIIETNVRGLLFFELFHLGTFSAIDYMGLPILCDYDICREINFIDTILILEIRLMIQYTPNNTDN